MRTESIISGAVATLGTLAVTTGKVNIVVPAWAIIVSLLIIAICFLIALFRVTSKENLSEVIKSWRGSPHTTRLKKLEELPEGKEKSGSN